MSWGTGTQGLKTPTCSRSGSTHKNAEKHNSVGNKTAWNEHGSKTLQSKNKPQ